MTLEGCARIIKCLVFFFNFIFFLCGVGLLGVGIYVHLKIGDYVELSTVKYVTGSILMIAVGTIIAVVAFFGCCGAVKESRCLLGTFFALMLLILGLEVSGTALGFVYRDEIESKFEADLNDTLNSYGEEGMDGVTKAYDFLQEKEKCCGVYGYKDWQRTRFTQGNHSIVPDSCCKEVKTHCGEGFQEENIHTEGCFKITLQLLKDNLKIIGGAGAAVAAIQVLAMVFALVLICKLKEQSTYA